MPYMKDYNFDGLKICNAYIADNSRYFCVGLVSEDIDTNQDKKDFKSILGIYKICPQSLDISLEMWIIQVSLTHVFTNSYSIPSENSLSTTT